MKNTYKPEGYADSGFYSAQRSSHCPFTLIGDGKTYEGMAVKCDPSLNLWVDFCGVKCMMPKDEVCMLFPGESLKDIAIISRVGKTVCFKIIGTVKDPCGSDIPLLSRRLAQTECLENYIKTLSAGDVIDAKITHMEQFGAFCDIGCGIVALLSVDCISVSRISHPSDRFDVGERIKVIVRSRSDDGRIYLTHKELLGTWEENAAMFSQGQTVAGTVRSVESYGIFVELSPNLAGLAEPRDGVFPSQSAAVYIKSIIPERMKIKLVLIDTKNEPSPKGKLEYLGDIHTREHIERWQYSPDCSAKIIESIFE